MTETDVLARLHDTRSKHIVHNTEVLRQHRAAASKSTAPVDGDCPDGFHRDPDFPEGDCVEDSSNDPRPRGPDEKILRDFVAALKTDRILLERLEGLRSAQELNVVRKGLERDPKSTLRFIESVLRKRPGLGEELTAALAKRRRR
jgi:hypothetical protein